MFRYWNFFTTPQSILKGGFAGGVDLSHAVTDYLKQISKKKLYIFDRRYGRFLQTLRGINRSLYKFILHKIGSRSMRLKDEAFKKALQSIGRKKLENALAAGNKHVQKILEIDPNS